MNIELLNAPIYKKFIQKTHKLQGKYIKFHLHPRSLNGTTIPLEEALYEWGFKDFNIALASTVEALENAIAALKQRTSARGKASAIVKEAIVAGMQTLKLQLKADILAMHEDILAKFHIYTDIMTQDLRSKIDGQFDSIDNQFKALMESLSNTKKLIHDTPQYLALPPLVPRHSK